MNPVKKGKTWTWKGWNAIMRGKRGGKSFFGVVYKGALVDELKTGLAYLMDGCDFPAAFNIDLCHAENPVAPWA